MSPRATEIVRMRLATAAIIAAAGFSIGTACAGMALLIKLFV